MFLVLQKWFYDNFCKLSFSQFFYHLLPLKSEVFDTIEIQTNSVNISEQVTDLF